MLAGPVAISWEGMGFLSREIVRRVAPLVVAGAAGAAGAVLAQRRLSERRRLSLTAGPAFEQTGPQPVPGPAPGPPTPAPPGPDPGPVPPSVPEPPAPTPDPIPSPDPTPAPDPSPSPVPDPSPSPVPDPTPVPDPAPAPPPEPIPTPPSASEGELEGRVRSTLAASISDAGGNVQVEVAGAMVVLRGRVDSPETIRELERTTASVPGVEGVRVLLHLPGRMAKRSR